ncbi:MAG TPA: hypothetical protein VFS88_02205 [Micavibrio sp.]|nr:hypothetical protein [Micavibrio sp.]
MKSEDLHAKMEKLNDYIIQAEDTVRGGKMMDLGSLDKDIADLCMKAVSLPPPEAKDLQPLMADMIGNLERLGAALKDFRDNLKH